MMITRFDELWLEWVQYDQAHPEVFAYMVENVWARKRRGQKVGAIADIFEDVRWKSRLNPVDPEKEFKIGNCHKPFYARKLMHKVPEFEGFFRIKLMFSKNHKPLGKEFKPSDVQDDDGTNLFAEEPTQPDLL